MGIVEPIGEDGGMAGVRTLGEACRQLAALLRTAGLDTPGLDARLLVAGALGLAPTAVLREPERPVGADEASAIARHAARRLAREPVSRILGVRAFHGMVLEIGPATLDPRPETEALVDGVLELVARGDVPGRGAPRILDAGTGSGAILIALLKALPVATGIGTDVDGEALAVAARNADRHGVRQRMALVRASWLEGVAGPFDLIVSNPPYVPRGEIDSLAPEVARHDPRGALDGGIDGLDAYRALLPAAGRRLTDGGWAAVEIGLGQASHVMEIAEKSGAFGRPSELRQWPDLSGATRCVAFRSQS